MPVPGSRSGSNRDVCPSVVSRADLIYTTPVARSEEGMPIGNGRMGTLVWTTPSALKFQINRVDIQPINKDTRSFFERNTDYMGGAGFVDVELAGSGDDVFTAAAQPSTCRCTKDCSTSRAAASTRGCSRGTSAT